MVDHITCPPWGPYNFSQRPPTLCAQHFRRLFISGSIFFLLFHIIIIAHHHHCTCRINTAIVLQNDGTHTVLLLSLAKELAMVAEDRKSGKWGGWYCILLLMDDDIGWNETKNNVLPLLTFKPFAKECNYYICTRWILVWLSFFI